MKELSSDGYILYHSIYVSFWKRQKCRNKEQISGAWGSGWREGLNTKGQLKGILQDMNIFLDLARGGGYKNPCMHKNL